MKTRNKVIRAVVTTLLETPLGRLRIEATPLGVHRVAFPARASRGAAAQARRGGQAGVPGSRGAAARAARKHLQAACRQLREYFAGRRSRFELPLDVQGTAYQRRVWHALQKIPFGRTQSYGQTAARLARRGGLGIPGAARAVGRACATNPVPVVVPCHRVVGSDATLHGYEGGLWRKRLLLDLENRQRGSRPSFLIGEAVAPGVGAAAAVVQRSRAGQRR